MRLDDFNVPSIKTAIPFFSSCSARTVEYEDKAAENLLYERYLSSASKLCVRKMIRHDYF